MVLQVLHPTMGRHSPGGKSWFRMSDQALEFDILSQATAVSDEKVLRAEDSQLTAPQVMSQTGSWLCDVATKTVQFSDEMFRITGIDREFYPLTLASCISLAHPLDQPLADEFVQSLLQQRKHMQVELRLIRPDGKQRNILVQGEAVLNGSRMPTQIVGTCTDVTEQKRLDSRLQKLLEGIGSATGVDFYQQLALQLSRFCDVQWVTIAQIDPLQSQQAQTVGLVGQGELQDNTTYDLQGTPCAEILTRKFVHFPSGIQEAFPTDAFLREIGVHCYMGIALGSSSGEQFGLIALMDSQTIRDPQQAGLLLRAVAPRVAAELEHARNAQVLRNSEERFRALVEFGYEGLTILDAEGKIVYSSPSNSRLLGYSQEQIVSQFGLEFIHPDDLPAAEGLLSSLRQTPGQTVETSIRMRHADQGGFRWLECRLTNLLEHPVLRGIVINWRDVTDRKNAEAALLQTERSLALFRQIVDRASDGIEVLDPETGRVLDINDTACAMHGYTREEYLELHIPQVDPTVSDPADWTRAVQIMRTTGFLLHQGLHRRKNGTYFPVEVSCTSLQLDREYIVAIVRDVTERKRIEEAIRESESRLRLLLENLENVAVQAYESDGTVTFWNKASEILYGYSAAEALGSNVVTLLHREETRDAERQIMAEAIASGQIPPAEEVEVVRQDGKRVHVFSSRVLRNRFDKPPEFFCFDVDVTARKKTEEELAVRLAELLHASRLSTVGEMVAAISHEVPQPLSAIGNFAATIRDILQRREIDYPPSLQEFSDAILKQNRRCGAILQRLRDYSRRVSPPRAVCDLNQLLRDSYELMSNELRGLEVPVQFELAPEVLPVYCDPIQMGQVVVNLLTNARDACRDILPKNRRRIVIRSFRESNTAIFEIEDHGVGISCDTMKRLFEAFYTTKHNGMGIGLKICQSIIREHHGQIEVRQLAAGGTIFRTTLPSPQGIKT